MEFRDYSWNCFKNHYNRKGDKIVVLYFNYPYPDETEKLKRVKEEIRLKVKK